MPKQVMRVAADDALTAVYRLLEQDHQDVTAARLARCLRVSAPSVAAMLARLQRDGFVSVGNQKRIGLSATGMARARQMVRRHRLAECLLIGVLGLPWWRAYEEAHLLEHAISEITEPLIAAALGHPSVSPFGYPIPGEAATTAGEPLLRLSELPVGQRAMVKRVYEEDEELLQFVDEHNLRPGALLAMVQVTPSLGMRTLRAGCGQLVIGDSAAQRVWVSEP